MIYMQWIRTTSIPHVHVVGLSLSVKDTSCCLCEQTKGLQFRFRRVQFTQIWELMSEPTSQSPGFTVTEFVAG